MSIASTQIHIKHSHRGYHEAWGRFAYAMGTRLELHINYNATLFESTSCESLVVQGGKRTSLEICGNGSAKNET